MSQSDQPLGWEVRGLSNRRDRLLSLPGLRERHFEAVIQDTLRRVILVSAHPRTLIQFTLQITGSLDDGSVSSNLPLTGSVRSLLRSYSLFR